MGLSRKGWVVLSTVIFISLIFAFYFLVYVKGNERKIVENNLRVLAKMKNNITNLLESEKKIAENQFEEIKDSVQINDLIEELNSILSERAKSENLNENNIPRNNKLKQINKAIQKKYPRWSYSYPDSGIHIFENRDSAVWKINTDYIYKKPYDELFINDLIERKDIFDFIAISTVKGEKLRTLHSNFTLGHINYPQDSNTLENFTAKNLFEIDFGHDQYLAFNALLDSDDQYEVYLTGYVNKAQFNDKKREVSVFFITIAIILAILMILAFPILKLRIMNNKERLKRKDVFLTGVSLVLGPAIIILLFLFYTTNMHSDKQLEKQKLVNLNQRLSENFNSELMNTIKQLNAAKYEVPNGLGAHSFFPLTQPLEEGKFKQYVLKDALNRGNWIKDFRYFNSIFWTDSIGNIRIYLSSEKKPHQIRSLNHREYVMNISNGNYLEFNGNSIAFESIRSVSDGNYEIGLGMVSGRKDLPVLAASFSLASLIQPILEEGYGFCLFNSEGRTLFHSDNKRNLNENFLDETGEVFNAYLKSGLSHYTSVSYMGLDHDMFLKKIPELDGYFLATFVKKINTHSPNAIAINMTIEMQLAFFALMFFFYLILYTSALKRSKLKQRIFLYNWLKPFAGIKGANQYLYIKLLGVNGLVFAYMLICWGIFYHSPDLLILNILSSGVLLIALNFWKLSKALPDNERMYTQFHENGSLYFMTLILGLVGLLFFVIAVYLIKHSLYLGIINIVLWCMAGFGIYRILKPKVDNKNQPKIITFIKGQYLLDYKLFVFSLIILFSVLPTLMFFSINFNKEKEILFKHNTIALKKNIDQWKEIKKAQFYQHKNRVQVSIIDSLDIFIENMEHNRLNYAIPSGIKCVENNYKITPSSSLYDCIYGKIRIEFDIYGKNSQGFINNGDTTNWVYDKGGVTFYNTKNPIRITGPMNSFGWQQCLILLIFLVLMLFAIFGLLQNTIQKIFGLDFRDYPDKLVLSDPYKEIANKLSFIYSKADVKKDSFNNSFIVGVNASHVYEIKEVLQDWKKDNFFTMELLDLPNVMADITNDPNQKQNEYFTNSGLNFQIQIKTFIKSNSQNQNCLITALSDKHKFPNSSLMVFIEHFEFSYDNFQLNKVKLNILQRLVTNPSIRVVISSEISLIKLYEFYEDSIKKLESLALKSENHQLENREKIEELKVDYKNWLHLFGGFFRITIPIEKKDNEHKIQTLNEELKHGEYLDRINNKFKELYRKLDSSDDYILNIQETSYSYYFAIWNSLSKEERYIVYDIAHDSFINSNNVDGIIDLLQKGILIYDHSLRLMNESFTNFVLTKVSSDEALERELESGKGGKWSTVSAVFLLVIISLIVFISFGKINMLEDVNALLGSLAAIFTLLIRMGGIFVLGKGTN